MQLLFNFSMNLHFRVCILHAKQRNFIFAESMYQPVTLIFQLVVTVTLHTTNSCLHIKSYSKPELPTMTADQPNLWYIQYSKFKELSVYFQSQRYANQIVLKKNLKKYVLMIHINENQRTLRTRLSNFLFMPC